MLRRNQAQIMWNMMFIDSLWWSSLRDQNTVSRGVWGRGSWCRWRWWWVRTIQADHKSIWQQFWVLKNSFSELSISRPTMTAKRERGGVSSRHTPVMWKGERRTKTVNMDTQLISLGWDSHLPEVHSYNKQGLRNALKITIIILWLGKTNFYFLAIH